jgi:asparagine synthase (glutamine-hydrolysing)
MRSLLAFAGCRDLPPLAIAWSGEDATGAPLVLAHTGAAVPVARNEQGTVRAVLAGTLYNARQLQIGLGGRHALSGEDDAELVAHLYEERGLQAVKALRGAFALALWDERLQRLVLARDQLGLVPLCYAVDAGRLAVASGLAPLAALPELAGTWDIAALDAFLAFGCVPPPGTFYTGIRQLGPGELAVWEGGRLRTQRYWQLTFPERRMTRPDVPRLLRAQMQEALRLRQAGVASALFLSGGLDATALLALAAAEQRLPTRTYSAAYGDADDDELRNAGRLAARFGVEHVAVTGDADWLAIVDRLIAAHGGPVVGPELGALRLAGQRARAEVGVVLAGYGGEEVFGGSWPVRVAERVRRFRDLPGVAREGAQLFTRLVPSAWAPGLRRLVDDERLAPLELYGREISLIRPEEREELYTADALASLRDARPWAALTALFGDAVSGGASETLDAIHYVELTLRLPARATAALAACPGLDLRLPLADHRLAQFVASVPAAYRGSGTERQLLLRSALAGDLPTGIAKSAHATTRPTRQAWTALLEETLAPDRVAAHGIFRPETIARLRAEHLAGKRDHAARLWSLALATRWLEGQPAAMPSIAVREAG